MTKGALTIVKSQEVNLLVSSPRLASGSSWRENIQDFESLSETIRFTRVYEDAIFMHRGSAGMSYKTRPDQGDAFGQNHSIMQRIYTFQNKPSIQSLCNNSWRNSYWTSHWSSDRENSWHLWTLNCNSITYDMISRRKSRFVDELHVPNAELRSSTELLSELQMAEGREPCLAQSKTGIQEGDWCGPCSKSY